MNFIEREKIDQFFKDIKKHFKDKKYDKFLNILQEHS